MGYFVGATAPKMVWNVVSGFPDAVFSLQEWW